MHISQGLLLAGCLAVCLLSLIGCSNNDPLTVVPSLSKVSIEPPALTMKPDTTTTFTANQIVHWTTDLETLSNDGKMIPSATTASYTAPKNPGYYYLYAASTEDANSKATVEITVAMGTP